MLSTGRLRSSAPPIRPTRRIVLPTSLAQCIRALPSWKRDLLHRNSPVDSHSDHTLTHALQSTTCVTIVSDGAVDPTRGLGTYGWVLSVHGEIIWTGHGQVSGSFDLMASFRAELCGALAGLLFLSTFCHFFDIDRSTLDVSLCNDNTGVIQRLTETTLHASLYPTACLRADIDLELGVRACQTDFHSTSFTWVKGHQDTASLDRPLTFLEDLNVIADQVAGAFLSRCSRRQQQPYLAPVAVCAAHLRIHDELVTSHIAREIREHAGLPDLETYLMKDNSWTLDVFRMINWKSLATALKSLTYHRRTTISKFMHEWLPVHRQLYRYRDVDSDECPSCRGRNETSNHVLRCRSPSRESVRVAEHRKLLAELTALQTDPMLQRILLHGLRRWHQDPNGTLPLPSPQHPWAPYRQLIDEQNQIGWEHIWKGRWSKQWATFQELHYRRNQATSTFTGQFWTTKLIKLMWTHFWEHWDSRNGDKHGRTPAEVLAKLLTVLAPQVRAAYSNSPDLSFHNRQLFSMPLADRLAQPARSQEDWLRIVQPIVKAHYKTPRPPPPKTSDIRTYAQPPSM
jgi:ribonuclease HI